LETVVGGLELGGARAAAKRLPSRLPII